MATISWYDVGNMNTYGVQSIGTLHTIRVVCDIQPANNNFVVGSDGARLNFDYRVFCRPFDTTDVPKDAVLEFYNVEHIITQIFSYQKHVEIKCRT